MEPIMKVLILLAVIFGAALCSEEPAATQWSAAGGHGSQQSPSRATGRQARNHNATHIAADGKTSNSTQHAGVHEGAPGTGIKKTQGKNSTTLVPPLGEGQAAGNKTETVHKPVRKTKKHRKHFRPHHQAHRLPKQTQQLPQQHQPQQQQPQQQQQQQQQPQQLLDSDFSSDGSAGRRTIRRAQDCANCRNRRAAAQDCADC